MRTLFRLVLLLLVSLSLSGCELVVGIFEVGVWVGALFLGVVILAVAGIFFWLKRRR